VTDYKVIKTSVLPAELTEVRFYAETVDHVRAEHPEVPIELPSITEATEQAISNPTQVEKSYNNSYVFVDAGTTNAGGDPLRVPVKRVSETSGRVKTVFFASTEGSRNVIYRKNQ